MRVGVLGGGQLGRMLALAGLPLGLSFRFLDPSPDAPARVAGDLVVGAYDDPAALDRLAQGLDLVTYEFENVPVSSARALAGRLPVHPAPAALEAAQDRLAEKTFLRSLGIPVTPFAAVDGRAELDAAVDRLGLPAVLKTRRLGYDGHGQAVLRAPVDLDPAWAQLSGRPLLLEAFVEFTRELSVLAARSLDGSVVVYPLVENHHAGGILRRSLAPAPRLGPEVQARAEAYARRVLGALDYAGLLAIELFEASGTLLANELAPRVHNSGHWTIEGAATSQFENHLRAVLGWPLGPASARGSSGMVNLIGRLPAPAAILAFPGAHLHLYGKAPRPGRKLGHVTVCADTAEAVVATLARLETLVDGAG